MEQALRMMADNTMARDFASLLFDLADFIILSAIPAGRTKCTDTKFH
jgi:hypothetical protein